MTVSLADAPEYTKDNTHVVTGYRKQMDVWQALLSLFTWHNETLNIWSHLLATGVFIWSLVDLQEYTCYTKCINAKWPLVLFLCSATALFATSTVYHTFLCVSQKLHDFWRQVDVIGIIIFMYTMFYPFCIYVFAAANDQKWIFIYISLATVTAIACVVTCMMPLFMTNEFHIYRPVVFGTLGILGAIGTTHGCIVVKNETVAILCGSQLAACFIGACFYIVKWPERNWVCASFFGSHFIFHMFVFGGIYCFYRANLILYCL